MFPLAICLSQVGIEKAGAPSPDYKCENLRKEVVRGANQVWAQRRLSGPLPTLALGIT